jgi:hypothetical protein
VAGLKRLKKFSDMFFSPASLQGDARFSPEICPTLPCRRSTAGGKAAGEIHHLRIYDSTTTFEAIAASPFPHKKPCSQEKDRHEWQ